MMRHTHSSGGRSVPLTLICLILCFLMTAGSLTACVNPSSGTDETGEEITLPDETAGGFTSAPDTEAEPELAYDPTAPVFSVPGGVFADALTLELSLPDGAPEGTVIRYTTDGSAPAKNSKSTKAYTSALSLLKKDGDGATVRAACFDASGTRISSVVTQEYVRTSLSALWTVMISVDEKDLNKITSNINDKIEKPAHVSVVTPAGETVIAQDAGLRLFGGSSRSLAQKSFKLIARKDGYFGDNAAYTGKGSFAYTLFEGRTVKAGPDAGKTLDKYDSFILRNGGNDSLLHTACDPKDATLLRDGIVNNWASKVAPDLDNSLSQFAVVYLNGAYYGILDMRENLNEDYAKRVYGIDDNQVVVVKSELDTTRHCDEHSNGGSCRFDNVWFYYETGDSEAEQAAMNEWISFCKEVVGAVKADDKTYAAMYEKVASAVDLVSFKEYMALNLYLCNTDWPHNNVKLWKYTGAPVDGIAVTDGRWRFMTRDMDMAMARYSSPDVLPELNNVAGVDTFWRCLGNYVDGYKKIYKNSGETMLYPDSLYLQGFLAFCLRNDGFRADFDAYCRSLASAEAADSLKALYTTAYDTVRPGIAAYIDRWSGAVQVKEKDWITACRRISTFIKDRPAKFISQLDQLMDMYK